MHEGKIEDTETGRQPADDGWFILNLAEIGWATVPGFGTWCSFESPGFYHSESNQEGFLVLSGECLAIVEGEERRMARGTTCTARPGRRTSRSAPAATSRARS